MHEHLLGAGTGLLVWEDTDSCNTGEGMEKERLPEWDLEVHAGQPGGAGSTVGLFSAAGAKAWRPGPLSSRNR